MRAAKVIDLLVSAAFDTVAMPYDLYRVYKPHFSEVGAKSLEP